MAERRCEECGSIIPNGATACPNCGCPIEDTQDNGQANKNDWQTESAFIHDNFNEKEPYSPFKSNSWFFKDPWPLYNYPKGTLYKKHPLIDWLLGPWYLTCRDKKNQEEYDVINNIFYFFNLIFKIIAYSLVWSILKAWWLILGFLLLFGINAFIISRVIEGDIHIEQDTIIALAIPYNIIIFAICLAFGIFACIVEACAMGKALHRYWPQLHKTFRRLNKRYWKAMLDKN